MGRHAAGSRRGSRVRPRPARMTAALGSLVVTAVALMGAADVLPSGGDRGPAPHTGPRQAVALSQYADPARAAGGSGSAMVTPAEGSFAAAEATAVGRLAGGASDGPEAGVLPARSGEGRRVVFSVREQRVWLVDEAGRVRRTYLVSGSLTDNLDAGTYEVYSTSRRATGIDDSGTMNYMVRFAHGERAAIGFHDIPVKDGRRLQTRGELGTPRSSGCIRQARPDAEALWQFAPVGTTVVVLA